MQAKAAKWLNRYPITDAEHVSDLEQRAAVHEFGGKMPRHHAEDKAYQDYRRDQLVEATAHHLAGLRAAHAAGLTDEAKRHATMYVLGLKALGHNNAISPPDEVASKALHTPPEVYRFKAHPADSFSLQQVEGVKKGLAKAEGEEVGSKPAASVAEAPAKRPVESRRHGRNGRGADGKKNPFFDYSDYVPEKLRGRPDRPSGITVHQRGREVIGQLNGGFGEARAFRRSDGGYALSYDGLKRAHPIVKQYREHVLRALGDHVREAHGAPYFLVPGEGKPN